MNYALVKELNNADFPVSLIGEVIPAQEGDKKLGFYVPTLSELIEACGVGFSSISRLDQGRLWRVHSAEPYEWIISEGSTPEEAVARFWLALNKK